MRAAIYARVSTRDKGQDPENQMHQLREYCARCGWEIVEEYVDYVSGSRSERDAFQRMFKDAQMRRFDVLIVWALDRLSRQGVHETFTHIAQLTSAGIQFESYTEPHFRTTGPAGELMLAIAAWIAKQERMRISERTKAGVERAKRAGKHCGRPKKIFRRDQALELRQQGMSWRDIAKKIGVSHGTIRAALKDPALDPGRKSA